MRPLPDYRIPFQLVNLGTSSAVASSSRSTLSSAPRPRLPCSPNCSGRSLHTSPPRLAKVKSHYEALSLQKNATKQQVKARFYELSKKHHPDAPGGDKDRFLEINDAYHTLGDDGRRRVYDNSQTSRSSGPSSGYYSPHSPGSRPTGQGPHRAWGRTRPPPSGRSPNEPYNPFARPHAYPRAEPSGHPGAGPFGRTSTGRKPPPSSEFEGLKAEGGVWRFSVVLGLLVAVISFGGGLSVSAEELDTERMAVPEDYEERIMDSPRRIDPEGISKIDA